MQSFNPYAPPKAELDATGTEGGCWRDGKVLVVSSSGRLPYRCVKCNGAAMAPMKERKFYWHHPGLYLLLLLNILVYALVALLARKKTELAVGLCEEHARRRQLSSGVCVAGLLLGLVGIAIGIQRNTGALTLAGVLLLLGAMIIGVAGGRLLVPVRIETALSRFKGCNRSFLDGLPDFRSSIRY